MICTSVGTDEDAVHRAGAGAFRSKLSAMEKGERNAWLKVKPRDPNIPADMAWHFLNFAISTTIAVRADSIASIIGKRVEAL